MFLFGVLTHVLDVLRHDHPAVHPLFIDRVRWTGEVRIRKGSHRYGDHVLVPGHGVIDGGATLRTEREGALRSFVSDSNEVLTATLYLHVFSPEPGLGAEDTSGSS